MEYDAQLSALVQKYKPFFDELRELTEARNAALQAADKAVRASGKSQGPFNVSSIRVSYDADALYAALGPDLFLQYGGTLTVVQERSVDKKRLEAAIALSQIPEEVVKAAKSTSAVIKGPKPVVLP
jgi:hypothetical protein